LDGEAVGLRDWADRSEREGQADHSHWAAWHAHWTSEEHSENQALWVAYHEALAEMMSEAAEQEQNEAEAEAMAGAAVVTVISPADRIALRRVLPHLVRGTAILTRILWANPATRPAVRTVPTIAQAHRTRSETPGRRRISYHTTDGSAAAAREARRVLGNPVACATAMANNVRSSRTLSVAA
jgi:16S rRNA G1207 methylase RsmC